MIHLLLKRKSEDFKIFVVTLNLSAPFIIAFVEFGNDFHFILGSQIIA